MELYWTKEKPYQAGIYFARNLYPPEVKEYVVDPYVVIRFVPQEGVQVIGNDDDVGLDDFDEFAGPIPRPRDSP